MVDAKFALSFADGPELGLGLSMKFASRISGISKPDYTTHLFDFIGCPVWSEMLVIMGCGLEFTFSLTTKIRATCYTETKRKD